MVTRHAARDGHALREHPEERDEADDEHGADAHAVHTEEQLGRHAANPQHVLDELETVVAVGAGHIGDEASIDPQRCHRLHEQGAARDDVRGAIVATPQRADEERDDRAEERDPDQDREEVSVERAERPRHLRANPHGDLAVELVGRRDDDMPEQLPDADPLLGRPDDGRLARRARENRGRERAFREARDELRGRARIGRLAANGDARNDERLFAVVDDEQLAREALLRRLQLERGRGRRGRPPTEPRLHAVTLGHAPTGRSTRKPEVRGGSRERARSSLEKERGEHDHGEEGPPSRRGSRPGIDRKIAGRRAPLFG